MFTGPLGSKNDQMIFGIGKETSESQDWNLTPQYNRFWGLWGNLGQNIPDYCRVDRIHPSIPLIFFQKEIESTCQHTLARTLNSIQRNHLRGVRHSTCELLPITLPVCGLSGANDIDTLCMCPLICRARFLDLISSIHAQWKPIYYASIIWQ